MKKETLRPGHQPVDSSLFRSAGFVDGQLELTYHNGKTYRYPVARDVFDALVGAKSPGQYYHEHVRKRGIKGVEV